MTKVTPEVALTIIALSMTALLGACAQTEQVTSVKPVGGFLPEPSALEPGESGQLALVYLNPDAKWAPTAR